MRELIETGFFGRSALRMTIRAARDVEGAMLSTARAVKRGLWPLAALAGLAAVTLVAAACSSGKTAEPAAATAPPRTGLVPGDAPIRGSAPAFTGQTFTHGTFDLAAKAGRPVVVNFWFPSCPPCKAELPDLQAAYEKFKGRVEFVGVQQTGLDSAAAGSQFWDDLKITFPAFPDVGSKVQAAYNVNSYPTTVFLDKDHNIVRKWTGLIDKDRLEENIQAILKG
jgi:thiol-disulfide isomerase/thioredoxin